MKTKQQHFEDYKIAQSQYEILTRQYYTIIEICENIGGKASEYLERANEEIYECMMIEQKQANKSAKQLLSPTKDKPTVIDNDPF